MFISLRTAARAVRITCVTCATALALCPALPARAANEALVSVGLAAPLSGISETFGKSFFLAAQVAIDQANQAGITVNGQRVLLALVPVDDRGDARVARLVAQYLVKKGVVGVIGHGVTAASLAAAPLYDAAHIAMISGSSSSKELTEQGYHSIYRTIGHDDAAAAHAASYLRLDLRAGRVATVDDGSAFGTRLARQFGLAFAKAGGVVTTRQSVNDKTSDFNEVLYVLKGMQLDAVFFAGSVRQAAELMQNMRRVGIGARFMTGSNGAADKQFLSIAGPVAEGALSIEPGIAPEKMAGYKQFAEAYGQRSDAPMSTFAPYVYDATQVLVAAIRLADSTDPARVAQAVGRVRLQGLGGRIAFDGQGNLVDPSYTIYEVRQQQWTVARQLSAGK